MDSVVSEKIKKAAIYIRVSTHYQIDKDSLPFQRSELENYCKYALNIDNFVTFEDPGYSGKNTERPGYKDMMKRVRAGEFTHIVVWKIDRISRNLKDFTEMYEEIKRYRVAFVSKNEQFDTGSAMGEAMLKIILVFAELERKLTAERVYAIMLNRAGKGLWNGANVPLGYKWCEETKFPVPDEDEAKVVKLIYDTYERTESSRSVFQVLYNAAIKTKRGGEWTTKTIGDVIRNPFYKGTYRYNFRESARGKKKDKSEWIVIEDNHEPIISTIQWEHCNEIMDKNATKNASSGRVRKYTHVMASLIRCGHCGKTYHCSADKTRDSGYKPSLYRCPNVALQIVCKNKFVSDIRILPFILTFIVNLVRLQNNFEESDKKDLEGKLLNGDVFKDLVGIHEEDLQVASELLLGNHSHEYEFVSDSNENAVLEGNVTDIKIDRLNDEVNKNTRALERLKNLYFYSDSGMSEKDFIIERRKIETELATAEESIKGLIKEKKSKPKQCENNAHFMEEASQFVLNSIFSQRPQTEISKIIPLIDKSQLKQFLRSVLDHITVDNTKIREIVFANDLRFRFVYRD